MAPGVLKKGFDYLCFFTLIVTGRESFAAFVGVVIPLPVGEKAEVMLLEDGDIGAVEPGFLYRLFTYYPEFAVGVLPPKAVIIPPYGYVFITNYNLSQSKI